MNVLAEFLTDIKCAFLPELIIAGFIFINIFLSMFYNKKFYKTSQWIAILGVLMSFASIGFLQAEPTYHAFRNAAVCNVYTVCFKVLVLISSFFTVLISHKIVMRKRAKAFEHFALLFSAILGAMILISANDFLTAFVAFEMLGMSCYMLSALLKNYKAKEAGLKYLINGVAASGVFLLGASYLYGITGTLNFDTLTVCLQGFEGSMLFAFAVILVTAGLMFKISAVPFANWVPDVYQGASYPIGMFLSLVPKIAGFAILTRILIVVARYSPTLGVVILVLALATIVYGTFAALRQTDMKRFMGYSSIIHSGFMLLVLGVINAYSLASMIYYMICYMFMNIAVWAGLNLFHNSTGRNDMEAYRGLAYYHPFYTTAMIFGLMALAGLPPTSGFIAKFFIMSAIARLGFLYIFFLLAALIITVVGLCFYFKPVKIMFEKMTDTLHLENRLVFSKITLYTCTAVTVLLCMYSSKIVEFCELIAYSLQ